MKSHGWVLYHGWEMFKIVYMGLWVLGREARWLMGPDRLYRSQIVLLKRQQALYQADLARMTTLAEPRREELEADLSLLEADLSRLEAERVAHRARGINALCARFPELGKSFGTKYL